MSNTEPGWYYADGDPPGTMRYWDGAQWIGEPTTSQPTYAGGGREYGGAGARLGARILDAIIVGIPAVLIAFAIIDDTDDLATGNSFGFALIGLLIGLAYEVGFTGTTGATPGKMILGLKVIGEDGNSPPSWNAAFMRWLPAVVGLVPGAGSFIALVLGIASGVMISSDDQNRSVQDRVGKTFVVKK